MKNLELVVGKYLDFHQDKDVIVNSSNQYMIKGSGISNLIYQAAGENLLTNFCKEYFKNNMEINEIRITPGFNLKKEIIHIYPPKFHFAEDPVEDLRKGYQKLFETIEKEGYKKVLMSSLGIGIHGFTHNDVAEMLMSELKKFLKDKDIKITLVLVNKEIKKLYQKYL